MEPKRNYSIDSEDEEVCSGCGALISKVWKLEEEDTIKLLCDACFKARNEKPDYRAENG